MCERIYRYNILVVVNGNGASPDALCPIPGGPHCGPSATSGSPNVYIGG